ncbi:hypothetical protein ACVWW4_008302 [Bradyrhizobium sp. LB7.1]
MAGIHALDRLIGSDYPDLATDAEVRAFEQVPYADRVAAESTYDAIRLGAAGNPDGPAIQFLQNADPADTPVVVTYRDFIARVTQAANMFHALGVEKGDVISFMLPLVPDAFVTLFGAEAAGIANPVNPLLEPHQIAEILEAANTKILVALGPMPGTDIWQKVEQIRPRTQTSQGGRAGVRRRRSGEGNLCLQRSDQAAAVGPAYQRAQDSRQRHRGLFPHGRHHRNAKAGAAHPCQPGLSGLGAQSAAEVQARRQHAVRHAAVSCRGFADPGAADAVRRRIAGRAVAERMAQSECGEEHLATGRALQAGGAVERADGARRDARGAARQCRHLQPEDMPPAAARRSRSRWGLQSRTSSSCRSWRSTA